MNDRNPEADNRDEQQDRFAGLEIENGVFIYHRQNHTAWIQCTESALITEMQ